MNTLHDLCDFRHGKPIWAIVPPINSYEIEIVERVNANSRPRMSKVDHIDLIEMFYISLNNICVFEKNRTCSNSFFHLPMNSFSLHWGRSGERIREWEFIGIKISSIGIDELSLELPVRGDSKCTDSWMDIGSLVDGVGCFDFSFFCQEGSWYVFGHIEISAIDDSIDYILFYM